MTTFLCRIAVPLSLGIAWAACDTATPPSGSESDPGDDSETSSTSGESESDTGTDDSETSDDDDDHDQQNEIGLCGFLGEASTGPGTYDGWQEIYLIGDSGNGEELCRVRLTLQAVGEPSVACDECEWSVLVEASEPTVVTDVDGVCASSDLGLDQAALAELDGQQYAYGYIPEFTGHENVLMRYDEATSEWTAIAFATWDATSGEFSYDKRDGFCEYWRTP